MKKILCMFLSLVFLFSCVACQPENAPETKKESEPVPYVLTLENLALLPPFENANLPIYDTYLSPDENFLYHFYSRYSETDSTVLLRSLARVDLASGEWQTIYHFDENYPADMVGGRGIFGVLWEGDLFTFFIGENNFLTATRFSLDTKSNEMTIETGLELPEAETTFHRPNDERVLELLEYNLPKGAKVGHATVVNGKLYEMYTVDQDSFYRELDLETKEEHTISVTKRSYLSNSFFGCFLLQPRDEAMAIDLYRIKNGALIPMGLNLSESTKYINIEQFREFVIFNKESTQDWYFVKDSVLNPLTVNTEFSISSLTLFAIRDKTLFFYATEVIDGVTQQYLIKGTISPCTTESSVLQTEHQTRRIV